MIKIISPPAKLHNVLESLHIPALIVVVWLDFKSPAVKRFYRAFKLCLHLCSWRPLRSQTNCTNCTTSVSRNAQAYGQCQYKTCWIFFSVLAWISKTRSSWLNCAWRDEAVYWVSIGHCEAVSVGDWWYWVRRGHSCLYILHKVEIWPGVTDAWKNDWLTHRLWKIGLLSSLQSIRVELS